MIALRRRPWLGLGLAVALGLAGLGVVMGLRGPAPSPTAGSWPGGHWLGLRPGQKDLEIVRADLRTGDSQTLVRVEDVAALLGDGSTKDDDPRFTAVCFDPVHRILYFAVEANRMRARQVVVYGWPNRSARPIELYRSPSAEAALQGIPWLRVSPEGDQLYFGLVTLPAGAFRPYLVTVDTRSGQTAEHDLPPEGEAWCRAPWGWIDGARYLVSGQKGWMEWDLSKGETARTYPFHWGTYLSPAHESAAGYTQLDDWRRANGLPTGGVPDEDEVLRLLPGPGKVPTEINVAAFDMSTGTEIGRVDAKALLGNWNDDHVPVMVNRTVGILPGYGRAYWVRYDTGETEAVPGPSLMRGVYYPDWPGWERGR